MITSNKDDKLLKMVKKKRGIKMMMIKKWGIMMIGN